MNQRSCDGLVKRDGNAFRCENDARWIVREAGRVKGYGACGRHYGQVSTRLRALGAMSLVVAHASQAIQ